VLKHVPDSEPSPFGHDRQLQVCLDERLLH